MLILLLFAALAVGTVSCCLVFRQASVLSLLLSLGWAALWIVFTRLAHRRRGWRWVPLGASAGMLIGSVSYLLTVVLHRFAYTPFECVGYWLSIPTVFPLNGLLFLFRWRHELPLTGYSAAVIALAAAWLGWNLAALRRGRSVRK